MSISIGIYDLFAYTIPGLFYLYVIFEALRQFKVFRLDISNIPDIPSGYGLLVFVLLVVVAHLLGHLLDYFAQRFVFQLLRRKKDSDRALRELKERYPKIDIRFETTDWNLLFTLLRQRSQDHTRVIDSFEANSIMLRNICFGLFWLVILQTYAVVVSFTILGLILVVGVAILTFVAHQRSRMFHRWFIVEIFEASLNYGSSMNEVVAYRSGKEVEPKTKKKKVETKRR